MGSFQETQSDPNLIRERNHGIFVMYHLESEI